MTELQTFVLPPVVDGSDVDRALGEALIAAWQADGIFQIQATPEQEAATEQALEASRGFFGRPFEEKAGHVSDLTYSGYVASGEEETAGEKDGSEIFTVCPDMAEEDARVVDRWPCHGPAPGPRGSTPKP
ncbi:2-oxoglutarate and iron-dependent oxygenase domain-containing protein [Streptomyces scabiei]|uniref:2-oxoglutarate and iron-dependent oxygenase domain-containing protein n=1 Tax=Streptomyces scabiei TaxID=1930 RepID=UPI001FF08CD8|nr:2-oxoglutarate and iron-dependent oxygenase domain-containing protein [Streptomyces sp. LBUM 1480]